MWGKFSKSGNIQCGDRFEVVAGCCSIDKSASISLSEIIQRIIQADEIQHGHTVKDEDGGLHGSLRRGWKVYSLLVHRIVCRGFADLSGRIEAKDLGHHPAHSFVVNDKAFSADQDGV